MSNLKGNLQSISLMDVVQLLHVNKKSGHLKVANGKLAGTLFVVNGDVTHAESGLSKGEMAAFDILEWDRGEFEFVPLKVMAPQTIRRSVPDLLMESARTSDSRKRLRGMFPDLNVVPCPSIMEPQLTAGLKLYAEDRKVIPYFDGYRTFLEIMATSGQNEVAVLQAASILQEAGRLTVVDPVVTVTVGLLKGGFFKKADHVELPKSIEAHWRGLGPYATAPVPNVRILWSSGPAVEALQFNPGGPDATLLIPKELMQAMGLAEGDTVHVRPAP